MDMGAGVAEMKQDRQAVPGGLLSRGEVRYFRREGSCRRWRWREMKHTYTKFFADAGCDGDRLVEEQEIPLGLWRYARKGEVGVAVYTREGNVIRLVQA